MSDAEATMTSVKTKPTYTIPEDVHGEIGGVPFEYAAGGVTPKDAAEKAVLEHLVSAGVAKRAGEKE